MNRDFTKEIKDLVQSDSVLVEVRSPPLYISLFVPKLKEVILLHKGCQEASFRKSNYGWNSENTLVDCSSVIGQPLEAPYSMSNTLELSQTFVLGFDEPSENHAPLPILEARKCLSICNIIVKPSLPVWVYCEDDQGTFLISSEFKNGWFKRGWATHQGALQYNIKDMLLAHTNISKVLPTQVKCHVMSTYDLRKIISLRDIKVIYSSTILKLNWTRLSSDPPLDSSMESTLITKCHVGKGSDGLFFFWKQLTLLQNFLDIVLNKSNHNVGEVINLPDISFLQEFQGESTFNNGSNTFISKLMHVMKDPILKHKLNFQTNGSLKYYIDLITQTVRPGLDLTDKLWYLLIECKTHQELTLAFQEVFNAAKKTNDNKLFIRSGNISRLARVLIGDVANFFDPLEYLIEIGLEKLKTEVLLIFSKAQIASLNSLNIPKIPKFCEISDSEWPGAAMEWLLWLSRIYCVLELLSNTQSALGNTANDSLLSFTNVVLKNYIGKESNVNGVKWLQENPIVHITVPIPMKLMQSHLEPGKYHFSDWFLTLKSKSRSNKVKSIFYKGLHLPILQSEDKTLMEDGTKIDFDLSENTYNSATLHFVSNFIGEI